MAFQLSAFQRNAFQIGYIAEASSTFKDTWFPDGGPVGHDGNYQLRYAPPASAQPEPIKELAQTDIYLADREMLEEEEFIILMALTLH